MTALIIGVFALGVGCGFMIGRKNREGVEKAVSGAKDIIKEHKKA